jgi:hypothetical protein
MWRGGREQGPPGLGGVVGRVEIKASVLETESIMILIRES